MQDTDSESMTDTKDLHSALAIFGEDDASGERQLCVAIHYNGRIEKGPAFTTNEKAADTFLQSLAEAFSLRLVKWHYDLKPLESGTYLAYIDGKTHELEYDKDNDIWLDSSLAVQVECWTYMPIPDHAVQKL
jgi:hypothetical protein